MDLFFASTETTSYSLSWTMLYLSLKENRHIQDRVQEEISAVVGVERLPELADRPK
jgi:cytochrome P450